MAHPASTYLLTTYLLLLTTLSDAQNASKKRAIFIFGDSLSDGGNNNYLPLSIERANYLPNGIDFRNGTPTGRFSNGRLVGDILAESLDYAIPNPYLSPSTKGQALLEGVNYASGGCGILNETSKDKIECLSLSTQLSYHENAISNIINETGYSAAHEFLSSSLYFVGIGSNDFLNNYAKPNSADARKCSLSQFIHLLTTSLGQALERLYNQSARGIVVFGLGPMGCIPSQRIKHNDDSCSEDLNEWAIQFNNNIYTIIRYLNLQLPNITLTFANPFHLAQTFIQQPSDYGFNVTTEACCGGGKLNAQIPCIPIISKVCSNRSDHMFWDRWHTSEATNLNFANQFLTGSSPHISPWNIQQLSQLQS